MKSIKITAVLTAVLILAGFSTAQAQSDGSISLDDKSGITYAGETENKGLGIKIGIGMGVPYGVFGAGIDAGIPHFSAVGGIGTTIFGGMGWSGGLRAYLFDRSKKFRPHFTAVYGTTALIVIMDSYGSILESYTLNGFGFYASLDHDVGDPGKVVLTYGIGFVTWEAPPAGFDNEDIGTPIKLMLGLNYQF